MFITNLEIENFRGIKQGILSFPLDTRVICMIGAGDSTKSTILKFLCYTVKTVVRGEGVNGTISKKFLKPHFLYVKTLSKSCHKVVKHKIKLVI